MATILKQMHIKIQPGSSTVWAKLFEVITVSTVHAYGPFSLMVVDFLIEVIEVWTVLYGGAHVEIPCS